MIITRTPFRISFSGGGSDLEAFYSREPGAVLSTAIDRYMYLTLKEHFGSGFRVSYSRTELVDRVDQIEHPIVRECLQHVGVRQGMEVVSMADLPAQSGMGSSSSFTVGLLHALHAMSGHVVGPSQLAAEACHIEIEKLGEPIGKQDQYIAAYGGLQYIQFNPDGTVFVDPVVCRAETRRELNRRLILFFTGVCRDAREVLSRQKTGTGLAIPTLRKLTQIARDLRDVLTSGHDLNAFGELLHQAWESKRSVESTISNPSIDQYYERGRKVGALGGKLLGAGGGGFLLFFCEPHLHDALREELSELVQFPFALEPQGSKIIYVGGEHW
jgi:D-glycero-alpha-D-manno-heptose-7-phosphate kinase